MVSAASRVFLSYTSELRKYPADRSFVDAAERAVTNADHIPVSMVSFNPADEPSADLCRRRVAECDIYLGIIGFRYGTPVPDGGGLSYTELEFEEATRRGLRRLLFLLDEDAHLPARYTQDSVHGARQQTFRRRLMAGDLVVASFRTNNELEMLVGRTLAEIARPLTRSLQPGPAAGFAAPARYGTVVERTVHRRNLPRCWAATASGTWRCRARAASVRRPWPPRSAATRG